VGIHRLLQYSCCFLNTNTAITRQIIRTVRTLEAEWWQVCGEAWQQGQRKMSQVMGAFGLLDFTMLQPVLAWRAFWNLWNVYFFNFPNFSGRGKPRLTETANTESADTGVRLYSDFSIKPNEYMMCQVYFYVRTVHPVYSFYFNQQCKPNHTTTKTMQQRKQNELLGVTVHSYFPTTKYTNQWTESQRPNPLYTLAKVTRRHVM